MNDINDISFPCSHCGGYIVIEQSGAGLQVSCPHCNRTIGVPDATSATLPALPVSGTPKYSLFGVHRCTYITISIALLFVLIVNAIGFLSVGRICTVSDLYTHKVRSKVDLVSMGLPFKAYERIRISGVFPNADSDDGRLDVGYVFIEISDASPTSDSWRQQVPGETEVITYDSKKKRAYFENGSSWRFFAGGTLYDTLFGLVLLVGVGLAAEGVARRTREKGA